MRILALSAMLALVLFICPFQANANENDEAEEMVHCCRFDCAPMYCQRWPKACYYIDKEHCERWIEHGHARKVSNCNECEFPRRHR